MTQTPKRKSGRGVCVSRVGQPAGRHARPAPHVAATLPPVRPHIPALGQSPAAPRTSGRPGGTAPAAGRHPSLRLGPRLPRGPLVQPGGWVCVPPRQAWTGWRLQAGQAASDKARVQFSWRGAGPLEAPPHPHPATQGLRVALRLSRGACPPPCSRTPLWGPWVPLRH